MSFTKDDIRQFMVELGDIQSRLEMLQDTHDIQSGGEEFFNAIKYVRQAKQWLRSFITAAEWDNGLPDLG